LKLTTEHLNLKIGVRGALVLSQRLEKQGGWDNRL